MKIENSGGYLSPSGSSYKDPNRASLTDITTTMINLKNPKKEEDQEKEVGYGIISKNYLPIMDPKASAKKKKKK